MIRQPPFGFGAREAGVPFNRASARRLASEPSRSRYIHRRAQGFIQGDRPQWVGLSRRCGMSASRKWRSFVQDLPNPALRVGQSRGGDRHGFTTVRQSASPAGLANRLNSARFDVQTKHQHASTAPLPRGVADDLALLNRGDLPCCDIRHDDTCRRPYLRYG
jgi:hypothetical protein